MQRNNLLKKKSLLGALLLAGVGLAAYGCQDSTGRSPATMASAAPVKGGAQLWSENCMRCHNLRAPSQYSNNEWGVIMHHMRVRADLTGEESDKILAFIKSANTTN